MFAVELLSYIWNSLSSLVLKLFLTRPNTDFFHSSEDGCVGFSNLSSPALTTYESPGELAEL